MKNNHFLIQELSNRQAEIFQNYFADDNGEYSFEGCWFRNQRKENANKSGYVDATTQRRRYVNFYDTYTLEKFDGKNYLALSRYYLCVSNTLPKDEIDEYLGRIYNALQVGGFERESEDKYINKNQTEVIINKYKEHPRNTNEFPPNYESVDIVVASKGYDYKALQDRIWGLSNKMYRMPDKRENPTYITNIKDLLPYLPAQVEMGCGPSISTNIPPLYEMHETYKVQNHVSGKFYFAEQDNLIENILKDEENMRKVFSKVVMACISAELTEGYKAFGELYKKGYFRGIIFNNNFDRLVRRMGIPEKILRIYDINDYIASCEFDSQAKSLVCMGCHADRRQVQRQARARGLKVIFIDPEGFFNKDGFEPYPIEGPRDEDIVYKTTFENAMEELIEYDRSRNAKV